MHLLNRHYSKVFAEFLLMWIVVGVTSAPAALICFLLEQKVPGNPLLVVFASSVIVFSLFIYTMPSLIACLSEHPSRTGVYFLNFLLGWTALGWVAAMCWAYSGFNGRIADIKAKDAAASYVPQISKIPAFCGVLLFVAAIIGGEWTSALNPHPSSQTTPVPTEAHEQQVAPLLTPASCIIVDTYRTGMSVQEFETEYMKRYHQQPICSSRTNMNGEKETSCRGQLDIGTVHTTAQFRFGEEKLFWIDGFFDPAGFNDIKKSFTASYGNPDGDQACEMGSMSAPELQTIAQRGGCEGLFWKRGPTSSVLLSQFDGKFSFVPQADSKTLDYCAQTSRGSAAGTDRFTALAPSPSATTEITAAVNATPSPIIAESTPPTLKLTSYANDKYGYRIDYPEDFTLKVTNPFGAGISLVSSDGQAELTLSGENNTGYRLQQLYDRTITTSMAGEIGYHTIGQNWFVVTSTAPDGKVWYTKTFLGRASINSFLFTFPANDHAKYDPIVTTIERSFRPGNLDSDH